MPFCHKCGQQIDENANNCQYCGAVNTSNPNAKQNGAVEKIKKFGIKKIGIAAGALVAAILVVVLITSLFANSGYKKAINNFIDADLYGKEKAILAMLPDFIWEELEDEYDVDIDEFVDECMEDADYNLDELEDEYGKNIKISYSIEEVDDIKEYELDSLKEILKSIGIKKKDIKKAVEIDLEMTIKGKDDKDTNERSLYLVKIGSKWYVYPEISDMVWRAKF